MQRHVHNQLMETATAEMNFSALFLRRLIVFTQNQGVVNTHSFGGTTRLDDWLHQVKVPVVEQATVAQKIQQQMNDEFGKIPASFSGRGVATIFELPMSVQDCAREYFKALPKSRRQTNYMTRR